MGLFSKLKGQFVDVIEWTEPSGTVMVHKFDRADNEIKNGAQLTVRESQVAILVNEGQMADVFGPGRYELATQNMPILTSLRSWKYGFNSPFKCDVYFINTHQFLNMPWGTSNPVMMRDAEFGMLRIRGFGKYSFKVSNPAVFLKEVFGTSSYMTVDGVSGFIKSRLVSGLSDAIAQSKIPALDLAANYDELGQYAAQSVSAQLSPLGLQLCSLVIENISLPDEVEKAIDTRTRMGIAGDMNKYAQFQTAEAIRDAANNPNGMAGLGAGMGAATMINQMMSGMVQQPAAPAAAAAPAAGATKFCSNCGSKIAADSKFCRECGAKQ